MCQPTLHAPCRRLSVVSAHRYESNSDHTAIVSTHRFHHMHQVACMHGHLTPLRPLRPAQAAQASSGGRATSPARDTSSSRVPSTRTSKRRATVLQLLPLLLLPLLLPIPTRMVLLPAAEPSAPEGDDDGAAAPGSAVAVAVAAAVAAVAVAVTRMRSSRPEPRSRFGPMGCSCWAVLLLLLLLAAAAVASFPEVRCRANICVRQRHGRCST